MLIWGHFFHLLELGEEVSFVTSLGVDISGITCPAVFPTHYSPDEKSAQVPCFALALEWTQDQAS